MLFVTSLFSFERIISNPLKGNKYDFPQLEEQHDNNCEAIVVGTKPKVSLALTQRVNAVGADGDEGPPVPIPNTEVKLVCVDNTWWATAREDR